MEPVEPYETSRHPAVRVLAALSRDPLTAPHRTRNDLLLAAAVALLTVALALLVDDGREPGPLGWLLLAGVVAPLVLRRARPLPVMLAVLACVGPYHAVDYNHVAPLPASFLALYTVASTSRPRVTVLVGAGVLGIVVSIMFRVNSHQAWETLRTSGWVLAVLLTGAEVRLYRRYIASVVGRAERAERTREEVAARRVAEERLRIARDLHDLLAHSITLIGVRTSVAAHVLQADPDRLDRAAIAGALDDIADTCRAARGELRATLEVLRADGPQDGPHGGPLPDLAALPALVRSAGAELALGADLDGARVPLPTAAAAYRIVQESLTNAVRHGGTGTEIRVAVAPGPGALRVTVVNTVTTTAPNTPADNGTPGFGIIGMRERARSTGGTLTAGPRDDGRFEVAAELPLPPREATQA
ncbi:sensor histidine kinase [Streptomyces sp. NPDC050504]|uniref:sensor histidine kinase n=1 Tax=Streptomyces sp. NPDC050504 TaxID=3365618 RepID=UPI0037BA85E7